MDLISRELGSMLAGLSSPGARGAGGAPITIEGNVTLNTVVDEAQIIRLYWGGKDLGFVDQEHIEGMLNDTIARYPDDVPAARDYFLQKMADRVVNGPFVSLFDAEFPYDRHQPPADDMVDGSEGLVSKRHLRLLVKKMENAKILEAHRIGTSHMSISRIFQNMDVKRREEAFVEAYKAHPLDRNAMKVFIYNRLLPDAVYEFDKDTPRRVHARLIMSELVQHLITAAKNGPASAPAV